MSVQKPILYSYYRSSCSWRVRIALAYKKIDYELRPVNLVQDGGQQHSDEYKALNPAQCVPALQVNGKTLTESLSILEFLEETYPEPAMLPKDPVARAQVRALALEIVAGIQPLQNLKVLSYVGDERKAEWAKHWIVHGFDALEKMLERTSASGKYCFGDSLTIADACLAPQIYNAARFNVDMSKYPLIAKIGAALAQLECVKSAHPDKQPDTPKE